LPQANERVDRPSERAYPSQPPPPPADKHPKQQEPPKIDIDHIVTTVQRRIVHHLAIERERRGQLR